MEIKGKVHCFFEQSGTFKNEFIKLGIPAEDYDIQNNFGETDHVVDLFAEIENAYGGGGSVFDDITKDDLIIAFFPCIYFSCLSQMAMSWECINYRKKSVKEATDLILERSRNREKFYTLAVKMLATAKECGIRLIMENPWSMQTYLKANFLVPPSLIDKDRSLRGDVFKKETAYWFINCDPTNGKSFQPKEKIKVLSKKGAIKGMCSEERSMISPNTQGTLSAILSWARNKTSVNYLFFRSKIMNKMELETHECLQFFLPRIAVALEDIAKEIKKQNELKKKEFSK